MSEAAEAVESESGNPTGMTETDMTEDLAGLVPDAEEMPDFDIYQEEEAEVEVEATGATKETEIPKEENPDTSWSSRVKKDRQLRKKEIEFKRREQEIAKRESQVQSLEGARERILKDPHEFFKSQGIDPLDFYTDWTNRIATGNNTPSPGARLSATEKELSDLKQELIRRDTEARQQNEASKQKEVLNQYYGKINGFMDSTEEYPLTKEQCSAPDVAEGIAAYYQETGVELGFKEAFQMIENGLREKEDSIFNDPAVIAKFKKHHGLDASNSKGRRSRLTLSNNLQTQPTKTPAEDMTDDEIHEFWKGKLFT